MFALTAWINGPKQTGAWNYDINDGYDRFVGHIFRGAYRYQYGETGGLKKPFGEYIGGRHLFIAANTYNLDGSGLTPFVVFRKTKIWRYKTEKFDEYQSDEIFSTTCHETGHVSHYNAMNAPWQFWSVHSQIQESWAIGVEWQLTGLEYQNTRGIRNYGEFDYYPAANPPGSPNSYAYQYWFPSTNRNFQKYSSLFINIIDDYNELGQPFLAFSRRGVVDDQVSGFTLADIESSMLKHIYGLPSLGDELKAHNTTGTTDAQIDLLLSFY